MTLTERIQTYLETYADHLGRKVTKSSPLTLKTARKRLYFSDFKEQLVHFNGTVVKNSIKTLLAVTGTLLVVLGIVCLCHPTETLVSLAWLIGLLTLCSGIFSFVFSLRAQRILPNAGTMMLRSILMLIIGVFFLSHNAAVTAAIPLACAFWIVFEGTSLAIQSFDFRRVGFPYWWLMLLLGLSGICLGFFAFRQPVATGMTISILIGLGIISNGINRFVALFGISRFEKALEEHKTLLR